MRVLRIIISLVLILTTAAPIVAQDKNKGLTTVVLSSNIKCNNCKNRIEKNIPYEKGVKDLKVDVEKKTITIVFKTDKNSAQKLLEAVEKLGYKSEIISEESK